MPILSRTLLKFQKPPMTLKQFMLRSEVLKLYRSFMKLHRLMDLPPGPSTTAASGAQAGYMEVSSKTNSLKDEWITFVRSEFRLRQSTTDEDAIRMMLAHGRRQLQEMERSILIATNRNPSVLSTKETSVNADPPDSR